MNVDVALMCSSNIQSFQRFCSSPFYCKLFTNFFIDIQSHAFSFSDTNAFTFYLPFQLFPSVSILDLCISSISISASIVSCNLECNNVSLVRSTPTELMSKYELAAAHLDTRSQRTQCL